MTTTRWPLRIDADLPGVQTTVTQIVDFSTLSDDQLRRVVRAVERGHTYRTGYIMSLVRAAAKHLGVAPPVVISGCSVGPLPRSYESAFANLIKLSDVRYQLWLAQNPRHQGITHWANRKSGWGTPWQPNHLTLWGFQNDPDGMAKEVRKALRRTPYHKGLVQLAAFIKSRPKFEVKP